MSSKTVSAKRFMPAGDGMVRSGGIVFAAVCCPPCPDCPPIAGLVRLNFSSSCHPHLCKSARRRALTYATLIHSLIIVLGQSPPKSLKPARCLTITVYGLHSARSRFPLFGCIALLSSGLGLVVRLEKGATTGPAQKRSAACCHKSAL